VALRRSLVWRARRIPHRRFTVADVRVAGPSRERLRTAGSALRQCMQRKKLLPQFEAFHEREGNTSMSTSLQHRGRRKLRVGMCIA